LELLGNGGVEMVEEEDWDWKVVNNNYF